jgi:HAD superfamily hydrolase (TIGR01484 family)
MPGKQPRRPAPRTLIADIEGTLTDRSGRSSSEELLHRLGELESGGVMVVLCSGRSAAYQAALREKWGLDPGGPCVAENGCSIFWQGREYVTFDPSRFDRDVVMGFLEERGIGELGEFDPDKNFAVTIYPPGFLRGAPYSARDIARLYRFLGKQLKGSSYGLFYTSASCEVLPEGVDKGTGLERLFALGRIDPGRAVYLGDGQNDIPAARLVLRGKGKVGAPADAVPGMRRIASRVAAAPSHRGALELIGAFFPENDNIRRAHGPRR